MSWNKYIGAKGEQLASEWLEAEGFDIIHKNQMIGRTEVDIIACKDNLLHFIEVKTRSNDKFGFPEQRIGPKKLEDLGHASQVYIEENTQWEEVLFAVLSIMLNPKGPDEYFLIEDIRI